MSSSGRVRRVQPRVGREQRVDPLLVRQVAGEEQVVAGRAAPGRAGRTTATAASPARSSGTTCQRTPCSDSWLASPTNVETGVNTSTTRLRIGRPDRTIDWITGPRPAPYQSVVQVKHFRSPGPEHERLVEVHQPLRRADVAVVVQRVDQRQPPGGGQRQVGVDDPVVRVHHVRAHRGDQPGQRRATRRGPGPASAERPVGGRVQRGHLDADVRQRVHGDPGIDDGRPADVEAGDVHLVATRGQLDGQVADVPLLPADHRRVELREHQDPHGRARSRRCAATFATRARWPIRPRR